MAAAAERRFEPENLAVPCLARTTIGTKENVLIRLEYEIIQDIRIRISHFSVAYMSNDKKYCHIFCLFSSPLLYKHFSGNTTYPETGDENILCS